MDRQACFIAVSPKILWIIGSMGIAFWTIAFLFFAKFNDGGWYTCAAQAVMQGWSPYSDFYYPHTPPYLYLYSTLLSFFPQPGIVEGRAVHILTTLALLGLTLYLLSRKGGSKSLLLLFATVLNPYVLAFLFTIKSYAFVQWLIFLSLYCFFVKNKSWAYFLLGAAVCMRISFLPLVLAYALADRFRVRPLAWIAFVAPFLVLLAFPMETMRENLFFPVPLPGFEQNFFNEAYLQYSWTDLTELLERKTAYFLRSILLFLPFLVLVHKVKSQRVARVLISFLALGFLGHLIAVHPYEEYLIPLYLPLYFFLILNLNIRLNLLPRWSLILIVLSLGNHSYKGIRRIIGPQSQILNLKNLQSSLKEPAPNPSSKFLCFDGYFNAENPGSYPKEVIMARFSRFPGWSDSKANQVHVVNASKLKSWLQKANFDWILLSSSEKKAFFTQDPQIRQVLDKHYKLEKMLSNTFEINEKTSIYVSRSNTKVEGD